MRRIRILILSCALVVICLCRVSASQVPQVVFVHQGDLYLATFSHQSILPRRLTYSGGWSTPAANGELIAALNSGAQLGMRRVGVLEPPYSKVRILDVGSYFCGGIAWIGKSDILLAGSHKPNLDGDNGLWRICCSNHAYARQVQPPVDMDFCDTDFVKLSPNKRLVAYAGQFDYFQIAYTHSWRKVNLNKFEKQDQFDGSFCDFDWLDSSRLLLTLDQSNGDGDGAPNETLPAGFYVLDFRHKTLVRIHGSVLDSAETINRSPTGNIFALAADIGIDQNCPDNLPLRFDKLYLFDFQTKLVKPIHLFAPISVMGFTSDGKWLLLLTESTVTKDDCFAYNLSSKKFYLIGKDITEAVWLSGDGSSENTDE